MSEGLTEKNNAEKKTQEKVIGRNEPCPCGSGKKYKRCCGVSAAPKLTAPTLPAGGFGQEGAAAAGPSGFDPAAMGMDQEKMLEIARVMQRLPKGQLQRFQILMQKAMAGKDVTREAAELENSLPPSVRDMLKSIQMPAAMQQAMAAQGAPESVEPEMTEEQARQLVAQAAAQGKIDKEEAEKLLAQPIEAAAGGASAAPGEGKIGRFWKSLGLKKDKP